MNADWLAQFLGPEWFAWIVGWLARVLVLSILLGVTLFAVFLVFRIIRNIKVLGFGEWPLFSKLSVDLMKLLNVTVEGGTKQDEALAALDNRLREVESRFEALDSKVADMAQVTKGVTGGQQQ